MKLRMAVILALALLQSCASIPPEFLATMHKEKDGIEFLHRRHQQSVRDLVDNWYESRLRLLAYIKQHEIDKITVQLPNPSGEETLLVVEKEALAVIEQRYDAAVIAASQARASLLDSYLDEENWQRLRTINAVNLDMTESLLELDKAQRGFYAKLVGDNTPFPTDFINETTRKTLESIPF